jgi:hypothetical protein
MAWQPALGAQTCQGLAGRLAFLGSVLTRMGMSAVTAWYFCRVSRRAILCLACTMERQYGAGACKGSSESLKTSKDSEMKVSASSSSLCRCLAF